MGRGVPSALTVGAVTITSGNWSQDMKPTKCTVDPLLNYLYGYNVMATTNQQTPHHY